MSKAKLPVWLCIIFLLLCFSVDAQTNPQITFRNSSSGTYAFAPGSPITVPFWINGEFGVDNVFSLQMYNASTPTTVFSLGSVTRHYVSFVNGTIPSGSTGISSGTYKLKIVTSNPVAEFIVPYDITINTATFPTQNVGITSSVAAQKLQNEALGFEGYVPNAVLSLSNTSTANTVVSVNVYNDYKFSTTPYASFTFPANNLYDLPLDTGYYTAVVTLRNSANVVSSKSFLLFNTFKNLSLTLTADNACTPVHAKLNVATTGALTDMSKNYPGFYYDVTWGDKPLVEKITLKDLLSRKSLEHEYKDVSSCGQPEIEIAGQKFYNHFKIEVVGNYSYFNNQAEVKPILVSKPAQPKFKITDQLCVDNPIKIINTTIPGESPTTTKCDDATSYNWYIDGVQQNNVSVDASGSLSYKFTTPGMHKIKLVATSSGNCLSQMEDSVCVSDNPKPGFKATGSFCVNKNISFSNTTDVSKLCNVFGYEWKITDAIKPSVPVNYTLISGNVNEKDLALKFNTSGTYKVSLTITSSCQAVSHDTTIVIPGVPNATLSTSATLCEGEQEDMSEYVDVSTQKVNYTELSAASKFAWTVSPGVNGVDYSISDPSAKYPVISFWKAGTYAVTVVHYNDCYSNSASSSITILPNIKITSKVTINGSLSPFCSPDYVEYETRNFNLVAQAAASGQSGTWKIISVPAGVLKTNITIVAKNNRSTAVNGLYLEKNSTSDELTYGTYKFGWTLTNGQCSVTDTAVINIYPKPVKGKATASLPEVCLGDSVLLTLKSYAGSIDYWQYNSDGTWKDFPQSAKNYLTVPVWANTSYRAHVLSGGTCDNTGLFSDTCIVNAVPKPHAAFDNNNIVLCEGAGAILNLNVSPGTEIVKWEYKEEGASTFTSLSPASTSSNYELKNLAKTTLVRVLLKNPTCTSYSDTATITVNKKPVIAPVANEIVCSSSSAKQITLSLAANSPVPAGASSTFSWQVIEGSSVVQSGTGNTISIIPSNTTKTHKVITIKAVPVFNYGNGTNCSGDELLTTITVLPSITASAVQDFTVCSGEELAKRYQASDVFTNTDGSLPGGAKLTFQWSISGSVLKLADGSTATSGLADTIPAFLAVNSGSVADKSVVSVTPVYNLNGASCAGTPTSYQVTVKPGEAPNAGTSTVICGTNSYTLQGNNVPAGFSGSWEDLTSFTTAVFSSTTVAKPTISGLVAGKEYTFQWTFKSNDNSCPAMHSQVKILVLKAGFTKDKDGSCEPVDVKVMNSYKSSSLLSYNWYINEVKQPETTDTLLIPANRLPANTDPYKDKIHYIRLEVKDKNGSCTDSYKDSVIIYAKPKARFTLTKSKNDCPDSLSVYPSDTLKVVSTSYVSAFTPTTYSITIRSKNSKKVLVQKDGLTSFSSPFEYMLKSSDVASADSLYVTLRLKNSCGEDSLTLRVRAMPNTVKAALNLLTDGIGCAPLTVKFNNASSGASEYVYKIIDASTNKVVDSFKDYPPQDSYIYEFTKKGNYIVRLIASDCSKDSVDKPIYVFSKPDATFYTSDEVCVNQTVDFLVSNPSGNSLTWSFGDGNIYTGSNPTHFYPSPGTYTITLTAASTSLSGQVGPCSSAVTTKTIVVLAMPQSSIASNKQNKNCTPFTYKGNSTVTQGIGAVEWEFKSPGGTISKAAGTAVQKEMEDAGTWLVKMKFYNENFCADSVTESVVTVASPEADFTASNTNLTVCKASEYITFTNASKNYSFSRWLVNGVQKGIQNTFNWVFTKPSDLKLKDKIDLIVINSNGCSDTLTRYVTYLPEPKASFKLAANSGCAPFKPVVTNTSAAATNGYVWILTKGSTTIDPYATTENDLPAITEAGTYSLSLKVLNDSCGNDVSLPQTITVTQPPVASFSLKDTVGCYGNFTLDITNNSTNPNPDALTPVIWTLDGSVLSTQTTPPKKLVSAGDHYIELTLKNSSGCTATKRINFRVLNISAQITADRYTGCGSFPVKFTSTTTDADTYDWDFGDGTKHSNEANPTHTFVYNPQETPYNVILTVANGGCYEVSNTLQIKVFNTPVVDFDVLPDSVIKAPKFTFNFVNKSGGAIHYLWSFGDGGFSSDVNPEHRYPAFGEYKVALTITTEKGCEATRIRTVRIDSIPCYMYVPNAFQPGNYNHPELQVFKPKAYGLKEYTLRIFTKNGLELFRSTALDPAGMPLEGWNGKLKDGSEAPQGVYIWDISGKFIDDTEWPGMSYDGPTGKKMRTGSLILVR